MKYEILVTPIDILDMPQEKNNNKYKKKNTGVKNQINAAALFHLFLA